MKVTVIGATGATGKKVVERLLELDHEVTAVARRPEVIAPTEQLHVYQGDVYNTSSMIQAMIGADVVISCIGPTTNFSSRHPLSKGFLNVLAANFSPGTVMSEGIPNILSACQQAGVQRLVMQSGINLSNGKELSAVNQSAVRTMRFIFSKAIKDKTIAEHAVIESELDWVIVRPSVLSHTANSITYTAGPLTRIAPLRPLSFVDCADCLVRAATSEPSWIKKIINVGQS
ncbi:SDR family oxidoreductase [Paenibacillus sp. PK4536]|uniref:NAD(P)-dependent oxidoreductase n=1 Tax=Paenibacillus sp. PK4536 TaxID=3024576 RepID=UPI0023593488|nr:NAD(P)-binding oxidoreductase [Paenibacillus sp. PK4536]WIM38210.1 SDR family oxidoreductase [Paenibacillus sp. PK4536]